MIFFSFVLFLALRELGDPIVWVFDLLSLLVDDDGTVVTSDDETLLECLDTFDVESIAWRFSQEHLPVTVAFK